MAARDGQITIDTHEGPVRSKVNPDFASEVMQKPSVRPVIDLYVFDFNTATPVDEVVDDLLDDPVMPLTVKVPVTVTDPTATPDPFTTVTVTVPVAPVLVVALTITIVLTLSVVEVMTDNVKARVATRPYASTTRIVGVNVPRTVGMPDSTPADESATPVGSVPEYSDHVSDPEPPDAASVVLYELDV